MNYDVDRISQLIQYAEQYNEIDNLREYLCETDFNVSEALDLINEIIDYSWCGKDLIKLVLNRIVIGYRLDESIENSAPVKPEVCTVYNEQCHKYALLDLINDVYLYSFVSKRYSEWPAYSCYEIEHSIGNGNLVSTIVNVRDTPGRSSMSLSQHISITNPTEDCYLWFRIPKIKVYN